MTRLIETLQEAGYGQRVITDGQIARLIGGSDARRYGLVNRALKDGSLYRIKRGLYTIGPKYEPKSVHPFHVAQAMQTGSYVSLETALSYHGWIPEGVYTTASIVSGRKSSVRQTDRYGQFSFHPIASAPFYFLRSVDRVQMTPGVALIAQPLRALMDLVAHRKTEWQGLGWIEQGLRIERDVLTRLRRADFAQLQSVYKHKKARSFLNALEEAVKELKVSAQQTKRGIGND